VVKPARIPCVSVRVAATVVVVAGFTTSRSSFASARSPTPATNHAPTVAVEVLGESSIAATSKGGSPVFGNTPQRWVHVRVTVDDPDHDRVSAQLRLGPVDLVMRPIVDEPSPAVRDIRWAPWSGAAGRQRIVVVAHDSVDPTVEVRGEARIDVVAGVGFDAMTRLLDVDGDDFPEVVVADPNFDRHGLADVGALFVFDAKLASGGGAPTPIVLRARQPVAGGHVGGTDPAAVYVTGQTLQQVELNGDAYPDLIARSDHNGGSLHVWFGGPNTATDRPDDATLVTPTNCSLGSDGAQWLLFHDVTGDGQEDVIAVAPSDSAVAANGGAIHVWAGGPGLSGTLLPTATLRFAAPKVDDHLGGTLYQSAYVLISTQCVSFHDVDGDGVDDVVGAAPFADRGTHKDVGAIGVWKGGASLVGNVAPLVELEPSSGDESYAQYVGNTGPVAVHYGDVDGDGVDDLVSPCRYHGVGGRIYVWKGGRALHKSPHPSAMLRTPTISDRYAELGRYLEVLDFDGDGVDDVIQGGYDLEFSGQYACGEVAIWYGRAGLSGRVDADVSLGDDVAQQEGFFGSHLALADVSGDGRLDLVVGSPDLDDRRWGIDVGALQVWNGGVRWSGTPAPSSDLKAWPPTAGARFGKFSLADVTGDGVLDLLTTAATPPARPYGSSGGVAGQVFAGGPSLAGSPAPIAFLESASSFVTVPFSGGDVTGDGVDDVLALDPYFATRPLSNNGALYLWKGGSSLTGRLGTSSELHGRTTDELLGWTYGGSGLPTTFDQVRTADVTGDGVLDLMIGSPHARIGGDSYAGRAYVVEGGLQLVHGEMKARSVLTRAQPAAYDELFEGGASSPIELGDLDRDGLLDWIVPAPLLHVVGHDGVGGVLWYPGARPSSNGGGIELLSGQNDAGHEFGR
jgi:hypothetical protein